MLEGRQEMTLAATITLRFVKIAKIDLGTDSTFELNEINVIPDA